AVFLAPLLVALLAGVAFPFALLSDVVAPGLVSRLLAEYWPPGDSLRTAYLVGLATPAFALAALGCGYLGVSYLRDRRRFAEGLESPLDPSPGRDRLARGLWEISRGSAVSVGAPGPAEIGRRYVALASENLGQPGFRELIVRAADLETGDSLAFVLLEDGPRARFLKARSRGSRSAPGGPPGVVDLRQAGHDALFFEAVASGLLPPGATPLGRLCFPKGGPHAGETHRLTDAALVAGCGIAEALAAGAEQVIVVTAMPERASLPLRRRGARATVEGVAATLERQTVESDLRAAERINRMVATLGHATTEGRRAWEDPATGRQYREFGLYLIRPPRRGLGPLEFDGAEHPGTEVQETLLDLLEQGYHDAYRLFIEPVLGAAPAPHREEEMEEGVRL
ncbi:MAG TPA: hypothetical protein VJU18_08365, partial [Vicinamibacteria bacterium]|nr:hypothetical protein [Vicinamibacteria bacterium]